MTKRIIDVDIVERILTNTIKRGTYNIMGVEYDIDKAVFVNILHKIEELATLDPAPAPQESIFDADGWRTDFENIPEYNDILMFVGADEPRPYFIEENDTMIVYGGTSKVNGVIKSNEQFFGKILKWKLVNKPTIPICKIEELATLDPAPAPQESIFDADGWCWDIDEAPITITGAKIKFFDILVTKKYRVGAKNEFKQNERVCDVWFDDVLKLRDKNQEKINIADINVLAWRPLPKLPNTDTTKNLNKGE